MKSSRLLVGAAASVALFIGASSFAAKSGDTVAPLEFLRAQIGFTDEELQKLEKGEAVARILETSLDREVAVFGAVWIKAPKDLYLDKYRDIEKFEADVSLQIREVGDPPEPADFDNMVFPKGDLEDLRKCEVGNCNVKLAELSLGRIENEVDWSVPNAFENVSKMLRRRAYEYMAEYDRGGNQALAVYRDKKRPTFVAQEFEGLLENTPALPLFFPELHRYLLDYPKAELEGAQDFYYWAKNDFGLKETVRLNHVTIYCPPKQEDRAVIASKQLYSSHYFHTALELRLLLEQSNRPGGFYLMSLSRSRSDGLTGFTGRFVRGRVKERARDGIETVLKYTKKTMEELAPKRSGN